MASKHLGDRAGVNVLRGICNAAWELPGTAVLLFEDPGDDLVVHGLSRAVGVKALPGRASDGKQGHTFARLHLGVAGCSSGT